ncbi:MAG: NUDIX hydrolase [Lachnospiraceae bacterium]|uniref:NUDIX hydrolase n=1 Tax=Candidatus Weimeria bifida TaxID=2599074 RepID=A0A6N7J009_9FIRM|nr:NUDIX hydrolase [Candidatus Weimeria bifida]RRF95028.1 MAG: NUDIX hydrolase [Lachnospiraceae bacterium]
MEHVERIAREKIYSGSVVDFYRDTMKLPDGTEEYYDFIHHRMGAAAVVSVTAGGKFLMVRQYRPALDRYTLELPAGKRDSLTEDTLVTAKRELSEETGYESSNWTKLLSLRTTVAFCDEHIDVYAATGCVKKTAQHLDPDESIEILECDAEDLKKKIFAGEIEDAKTVAGIMAFLTYQGEK